MFFVATLKDDSSGISFHRTSNTNWLTENFKKLTPCVRWDTRTLRKRIDSMLYERTAISRKPEALAKKALEDLREGDHLSPDLVFRDPYVLVLLNS